MGGIEIALIHRKTGSRDRVNRIQRSMEASIRRVLIPQPGTHQPNAQSIALLEAEESKRNGHQRQLLGMMGQHACAFDPTRHGCYAPALLPRLSHSLPQASNGGRAGGRAARGEPVVPLIVGYTAEAFAESSGSRCRERGQIDFDRPRASHLRSFVAAMAVAA